MCTDPSNRMEEKGPEVARKKEMCTCRSGPFICAKTTPTDSRTSFDLDLANRLLFLKRLSLGTEL